MLWGPKRPRGVPRALAGEVPSGAPSLTGGPPENPNDETLGDETEPQLERGFPSEIAFLWVMCDVETENKDTHRMLSEQSFIVFLKIMLTPMSGEEMQDIARPLNGRWAGKSKRGWFRIISRADGGDLRELWRGVKRRRERRPLNPNSWHNGVVVLESSLAVFPLDPPPVVDLRLDFLRRGKVSPHPFESLLPATGFPVHVLDQPRIISKVGHTTLANGPHNIELGRGARMFVMFVPVTPEMSKRRGGVPTLVAEIGERRRRGWSSSNSPLDDGLELLLQLASATLFSP